MSFNLTGNYFGSEPIGYNNQHRGQDLSTNSRAIIFVCKPHANQFRDVALRPSSYRFDENFIAKTQEMTDLAMRGTVGETNLINNMMSDINFSNNMVSAPAPIGTAHLSSLSDKWRFILMLTDNAQSLNIGGSFSGPSLGNELRRIYTGYFLDEPYNPTTFIGEQRTLNPHAILVITHKTSLGMSTTSGAWGSEKNIQSRSSEEIVNPMLISSICSGNLGGHQAMHVMTPENCIGSVDVHEGVGYAVPGAYGQFDPQSASDVVNDVLEQPTHNVAQIVRGIVGYQDNVLNQNQLSMYRAQARLNDPALDDGFARTKLSSFMGIAKSRKLTEFDLDVNAKISIVDIDAMVNGQLTVQPLDIQRPLYYDTLDQQDVSLTNQHSHMIAFVVNSILNSAGLLTMDFEYEIQNFNGIPQQNFITFSSSTAWDTTPQIQLAKTKAVESELVRGVFRTIFESLGDFHVRVSCNTTGMTAVRLSLVEQGYINTTDFEIPSCMGGIITPLIGDMNTFMNNAHEIEGFYNRATGSVGGLDNYTDDDKEFADFAMGFGRGNGSSPFE